MAELYGKAHAGRGWHPNRKLQAPTTKQWVIRIEQEGTEETESWINGFLDGWMDDSAVGANF
jgi:hypothetical protein